MSEILTKAQNWLEQDPDPETRAELQALIESNNTEELEKRFAGRLQFGTAGLRGPLQAGPMGMNRMLVAQAARGLALYLNKTGRNKLAVIGCDARKNSAQFAKDSAEILQGAGINVYLLPAELPTPVLAFAVRHLGANAGIMVTASHNPPEDNGYKVYLGGEDDGAQIVPPADAEIAACIDKAAGENSLNYPKSGAYQQLDDSIHKAYIQRTAALADQPPAALNYVYTAMHGVGKNTLLAVLEKAGYPAPVLVKEQAEPDGTFPTVSFPNPEEQGALDLAMMAANYVDAPLILANDPDADRLAAAIRNTAGWQILHGNTIGLWLAWEAAKKAQQAGKTGTLACSLVSSPLLGKIAAAYGLAHQETLTGFKWIGRVPNLIFGYEEALGYLADPDKVHDKDGISAAVAFLNLALRLQAEGKSFADYDADFRQQFGAAASGQVSLRFTDTSRITALLDDVRKNPPAFIAGIAVTGSKAPDKNILVFTLQDGEAGARVIYRPSGTEPKLKIYLDTHAQEQAQADALLDTLKTGLEAQYASE